MIIRPAIPVASRLPGSGGASAVMCHSCAWIAWITGIAAGLHAVADLPPGYDEAEVAASHGVSIEGLSHYEAAERDAGPAIVIGYGRPAEHAFSAAVSRLCAALAESRKH